MNVYIFVDSNHLKNEILTHMSQLHTFTFYISTKNDIDNSALHLSNDDIQRTFKNIGNQPVTCIDLSVNNLQAPFCRCLKPQSVDNDWLSLFEYPHLISLDISFVDIFYVEHFLDDTKTHPPRLTELIIRCGQSITVTENFTKGTTRNNCTNVKRLIVKSAKVYPKDIYRIFRHYKLKLVLIFFK